MAGNTWFCTFRHIFCGAKPLLALCKAHITKYIVLIIYALHFFVDLTQLPSLELERGGNSIAYNSNRSDHPLFFVNSMQSWCMVWLFISKLLRIVKYEYTKMCSCAQLSQLAATFAVARYGVYATPKCTKPNPSSQEHRVYLYFALFHAPSFAWLVQRQSNIRVGSQMNNEYTQTTYHFWCLHGIRCCRSSAHNLGMQFNNDDRICGIYNTVCAYFQLSRTDPQSIFSCLPR